MKQEMRQHYTGIGSSRKNYYDELRRTINELEHKNKQLEVINELTKIQVNSTLADVCNYIASLLERIFSIDHFIFIHSQSPFVHACCSSRSAGQWSSRVITRQMTDGITSPGSLLQEIVQQDYPGIRYLEYPFICKLDNPCHLALLKADQANLLLAQEPLFDQMTQHISRSLENVMLYKDAVDKAKLEAQLWQSAKMAAVGELAAGVAHELNSPLTAILGNIQLLMRHVHEEPLIPMMTDIYQCGIRCEKIIRNLLAFSRQEPPRFEHLRLGDIIQAALSLITFQLGNLTVKVEWPPADGQLIVFGCRLQLEQVLINLLLNAKDACEKKPEPLIVIETSTLCIGNREYAVISVTDNGTGISWDELSTIFQPFYTTKENMKGTGLGLSISLGIVEAHGGEIHVESDYGRYSKFSVRLPKGKVVV